MQAAFRTSPRTNRQRPGPPRNTPVRLVTFSSSKGVPGPYAGVMKTLVSKNALNRMALCICFLSALPIDQAIAQDKKPLTIPMTADHWQTKENAEFLRQLGFYHGLMRLNSGDAVLKGITFSDGTIEFDVNTIGRGAPGIAFRQQDDGNCGGYGSTTKANRGTASVIVTAQSGAISRTATVVVTVQ